MSSSSVNQPLLDNPHLRDNHDRNFRQSYEGYNDLTEKVKVEGPSFDQKLDPNLFFNCAESSEDYIERSKCSIKATRITLKRFTDELLVKSLFCGFFNSSFSLSVFLSSLYSSLLSHIFPFSFTLLPFWCYITGISRSGSYSSIEYP